MYCYQSVIFLLFVAVSLSCSYALPAKQAQEESFNWIGRIKNGLSLLPNEEKAVEQIQRYFHLLSPRENQLTAQAQQRFAQPNDLIKSFLDLTNRPKKQEITADKTEDKNSFEQLLRDALNNIMNTKTAYKEQYGRLPIWNKEKPVLQALFGTAESDEPQGDTALSNETSQQQLMRDLLKKLLDGSFNG